MFELCIAVVLALMGVQGAVWWAGHFITGVIFTVCFFIACVLGFFVLLNWFAATDDSERIFLPTMGSLFCGLICAGIIFI